MLHVHDWLPYNAAGSTNADFNSLVIGTRFGPDGALYMGRFAVGCCRNEIEPTDETQIVKVEFNVQDELGEPDLAARVRPSREKVKPGKQARFELTVRNRGEAAAEDVELCVKAPARKVKVLGKDCRAAASLDAGESVDAAFRLKPKRSAAGDRINVRFTATAANAGRATDSATLKVEKKGRTGDEPAIRLLREWWTKLLTYAA